MKNAFLKIAEAARKESHTGYGDYAVFGGFSAYVDNLLEGREDDDSCIIRGAVRHYANSNLKSRKAIVDLVLKLTEEYLAAEESDAWDAPFEVTAVFDGEDAVEELPEEIPHQPLKPKKAVPEELCYLKGVGPKKAELLQKLGIKTVYDLCEYFPYRHEDRRFVTEIGSLYDGESALISGYVDRVELNRIRNNMQILKARLTDGSGYITVVWFNQPWLKQQLFDGRELTVYGKAEIQNGRRTMNAMEYELKHTTEGFGILPVYGLTAGINQKTMRKIVASALDVCGDEICEFLPADFRRRYGLEERKTAILNYHIPKDFESLQESRRRLVFEEFFLFRLAFDLKHNGEVRDGISMRKGSMEDYFRLLPFAPTNAQRRAIKDIYTDMASSVMMNRLLEGDVGSGKTVVAAAAVYRCVKSGHQCALMAPTEILAEQHYNSLTKMFANAGIRIALLTGSVKAAEKRKICKALKDGDIDLMIGTHALIESAAEFRDLALVIIDEQHRFGVNQRNALFMKGSNPDLLVMTATPIPRTLAMTVFSGLDLSVLDEMPPGRKPIRTLVITDAEEERAIEFMRKHVTAGHQCYVVCPLVEESEKLDVEAATKFYERLAKTEMKGISVGLVHGKMKAKEKDDTLRRFRDNEISVLVATTVIEVGIDVPNATVMYVKNADRFGLAQLHQIRGRIGRGESRSTCILQSSGKNETSMERLKVMEQHTDGFKIAEEDLKLRGPGDFFGVRQHGLPEMNLADLFRDHALLEEAASAVHELLAADPDLSYAEWQETKKFIANKYIDQ